jgi:signal transduction histidine kinase
LPYIRISQYKNLYYRLSYLALLLISVVIFSTSAESPTYVIAVTGVALWFIVQPLPTTKKVYTLLIFAIIVTTFSVTDVFPHWVRVNFFIAYALKALPCFCVWLVLLYQLLFKKYQLNLVQSTV